MIMIKSDGQAPPGEADVDVASWQWLHRLIKTLGEHGMSSEESSVENGVENVLRVKQMEWWRNIDHELEIIDREHVLDSDIFSAQGSKPLPRKRAMDNPPTSRNSVNGLPLALYDIQFLASDSLDETQRLRVIGEGDGTLPAGQADSGRCPGRKSADQFRLQSIFETSLWFSMSD
ncbi:hypothetical protein BU15DRAFT_66944 [Melanogaster broomeanus]|nr:hypothetical protein BU15DRAFT_66944 [Melanogaster broomeanus]